MCIIIVSWTVYAKIRGHCFIDIIARTHNSKFTLCGLTFEFEKLYLRFMFVVADNLVFQNPAHRKLAKRYMALRPLITRNPK